MSSYHVEPCAGTGEKRVPFSTNHAGCILKFVERSVQKYHLSSLAQREAAENLAWWLSRPVEERIAEVERLRKSYYGTIPRLERVARVVSQTQR